MSTQMTWADEPPFAPRNDGHPAESGIPMRKLSTVIIRPSDIKSHNLHPNSIHSPGQDPYSIAITAMLYLPFNPHNEDI
jgi:hypothetical protein